MIIVLACYYGCGIICFYMNERISRIYPTVILVVEIALHCFIEIFSGLFFASNEFNTAPETPSDARALTLPDPKIASIIANNNNIIELESFLIINLFQQVAQLSPNL